MTLYNNACVALNQVVQQFVRGIETEHEAAQQSDVTAEAVSMPVLVDLTSEPEQTDVVDTLAAEIASNSSVGSQSESPKAAPSDSEMQVGSELQATRVNEQPDIPKTLRPTHLGVNTADVIETSAAVHFMTFEDSSARPIPGGFAFAQDQV